MAKRLELWGLIATGIAVAGVVLNNGRSTWCFPLWIASNAITLALHVRKRMWSLALRDSLFIALAVAGWRQWTQ